MEWKHTGLVHTLHGRIRWAC